MLRNATLLAALLALSCAGRPEPRMAIQADAIAKSDLDGVWYFQQTVVGVPFSTGFTFIGEQGEQGLEKIRWDVQEDVLTARRAYEFVKGTEVGEPTQEGRPYLGAPVAAFRIKSHFDIIREYNPSTGEEYDKLVENTERKWYERQFIRVDWSENLVSNFNFLADWNHGGIGAIRQDPAPYYVSDPKDPDAMRLERPGVGQPANYLEVTQKIIASPETVDFEDFANVPLCWLEYATQDCASQEIRIRNSFLKVGARDYEPRAYGDLEMERFGFFTTARSTYNRQYGQTESGRLRLLNRHNIWQHSLSEASCTADSDCGPERAGVRCVKELPDAPVASDGSVTGRCSIPFATRNLENPFNPSSIDLGPKKIVYYLNDHFPAELKETARQMATEFDLIFQGMYQELVGRPAGTTIFTLCTNNPVQPGDPYECGPAGTHARIGDLRYSLLYWVDEPTSAQLLGYGPSSVDPETGEIVSASAFIYGAMIDVYASTAKDIIRLVNGTLPPDQFISGVDLKAWVESHRMGLRNRAMSQAEVDAMAGAMDFGWAKTLPKTPAVRKGSTTKLREMIRERSSALAKTQALGAEAGLAARRLSRLAGTELEQKLTNSEMLLARGMDPRLSGSAIDPSKVGTLSLVNPERARLLNRERRRLGAHAVDLAASFDDSVLGLALQQQDTSPEDLWRVLRRELFRATGLHELGHTFGLRHNFAASYDPMNYPKTYWDLRTRNGAHTPQVRYLDPERFDEQQGVIAPNGLRAGISEFMQSSIMDYGAGFASDINGLGRYDNAALKYGYGQLVEVFNNTYDTYRMGALQASVTFGEAQPLMVSCAGDAYTSVHYTQLPLLADLDSRSNVHAAQVTRSVLRPDCAYPDEVDHDAQNRMVVPYKFCSDEFEGSGVGCSAFDRGADVYEVATALIDEYRNYYLFRNFKRDRMGFSPDYYMDDLFIRTLDPLRSQMQFYALYRADLEDAIPDDGTPGNFWRSPTAWGPFTVAVTKGFDALGEILTTPEPGGYYLYQLDDNRAGYLLDEYSFDLPDFNLTVPQARFFETEWELDSGYYWYERVRHIGSFLDKVAVLIELTDPETYFLGKDLASDYRQYAINYYRLYPSQMDNLLGAVLTDRWDLLGSTWTGSELRKRPLSQPIPPLGAGEYPVDPALGFSIQLYAATFGVALIPATYDQSFMDSSRIWLDGNGDQLTPTLPTVSFDDAKSGRRYMAISYQNAGTEKGIAARMIARANELKALAVGGDLYAAAALDSYVQVLEVMRSLTSVYKDPIY